MRFEGRSKNSNNDNETFDTDSYYYDDYYYDTAPVSASYIIMEIVVALFIVIFLMLTYHSSIIDPIEDIKTTFLNRYLITTIVFIVVTLMVNFLTKDKGKLLKRLTCFFAISMITMLIFFGIKLNLDITYTRLKFEEFYVEQNDSSKSSKDYLSASKIDVGFNGVKVKTDKEYYVDECVKLYGIFKMKVYGVLGLHLLFNILLAYQISRIAKIKTKKDKVTKNDAVLFDDEENVKY